MSGILVCVEVQLLLSMTRGFCRISQVINPQAELVAQHLSDTFSDTTQEVTPLLVSLTMSQVNILVKYLEVEEDTAPLRLALLALRQGLERLKIALETGQASGNWECQSYLS